MPKYDVYGEVQGTKYLGEYEAESPEEAEEMAMEAEGSVRLCHQCHNECEDAEIVDCKVEEVEDRSDTRSFVPVADPPDEDPFAPES